MWFQMAKRLGEWIYHVLRDLTERCVPILLFDLNDGFGLRRVERVNTDTRGGAVGQHAAAQESLTIWRTLCRLRCRTHVSLLALLLTAALQGTGRNRITGCSLETF